MKLSTTFGSLCLLLLAAVVTQGQFFTLPGDFSYSLNSINQVFDVSADGKLAVTLRNDPVSVHPAFLTSFDPIFATQFDSKTFGFGPLGVRMAQTANGLRVVVLTSEGGPRRIYLFDLSATGVFTQLASTQLTTSIVSSGSNLVLSGTAQAGFAIVAVGNGITNELVSFSLVDGAIINRFPISGGGDTLAMAEPAGKRLLTFLKDTNTLEVVDVTNAAQPIKLGDVPFPANNEFSGSGTAGIAFSSNGQYAFVGDQFADFAVIDLVALQTISTIPSGSNRFGHVRIYEDGQRRLIALQSSTSGSGGQASILLLDATDPFHLSIINQLNFTSEPFGYKSDMAFSKNGSRLFVQNSQKLIAYDLPAFTKAWEEVATTSFGRENQISVYGNDEVLAAWEVSGGLGFVSLFGAFPGFPPTVSINDAATVSEGDSGTSDANFNVSLSAPTNHRATINYVTANGTAVQNLDFFSTTGALIFEPGETTRTATIAVLGDTTDEFDETFALNITASVGIVTRAQAIATILDDDSPPSVTISDTTIVEGNTGIRNAAFSVSLSAISGKPITLDYSTSDDTATAGSDYTNSSGVVSFAAGDLVKTILVPIIVDTINEPDETFFASLTNPVNVTIVRAQAKGTIVNDDTPTVRFASANSTVSEASGSASITVVRGGDISSGAAVDYASSDGTATQRTDYTIAAARLNFAPGESSKAFTVLISDDLNVEGSETIYFALSNPSGANLAGPATKILTIADNDSSAPTTNPLDTADFFVRQHYYDFLSRLPDPDGFSFWTGQITQCGSDQACLRAKRIDVSNAFFYELEFQQTGAYVYRLYRAAFGNHQPFPNTDPAGDALEKDKLLSYDAFVHDRARVVGGASLAQAQLDLANAFVQRPEFLAKYPASLDGPSFVNAVLATINSDLGSDLTSQRSALITLHDSGGRGAVMYRLADDNTQTNPLNNRAFIDAEYNRAFVATQYFGYLRRDPDMAGFLFWLGQVNSAPLRDVGKQHAMVCSFTTSAEYQQRFSPQVTHSNSECQ